MARVSLADPADPALKPLADRIAAERGEVLELYRVLLHSPPVADGWRALMTAIRQQTTLPGALREMIIVRIAHLNGAGYEAEQHVPIARREGVTPEQLAALADGEPAADLFSAEQRAALALTDAMTGRIRVEGDVWQAVRAIWSEREIVELVATIASYNMVSRFLEALEIHGGPTGP
jgi:AhpD family alkylhydroperoxidase